VRCAAEVVIPFLLLISAYVPVLQASPQEGSQTSQTETVRGVVINSITHEPIPRALVSSPDNRFATMTDSQGRFEFSIPRQDNNQSPLAGFNSTTVYYGTGVQTVTSFNGGTALMARKPGFISDPAEGAQNVPPHSGQEITISLVPEALIVGRVVLPSSDGATPIQLQLYRRQVQEGRAHWVLAGDTTARTNGEFRFADLSPGLYKLFTLELLDQDPETFRRGAQLYGYPPAYFPEASNFASATTIHLAAGKTFHAEVSPRRQPYYTVKVPVANAVPGAPIGVSVLVQGRRGPGFSLGYNDRDRSIEGMLPNGVYTLEATSYGPTPANGVVTISVRDGAAEGPPMILSANSSIPVNVRWELTSIDNRQSEMVKRGRGRYVNVRLEPAEDFGQQQSGFLRNPTNPKDDTLVIDGVAPGRYWVHLDPVLGFPASVSSGGVDLLHHPLIVAAGGTSPIEITMRDDGATIEGTIEGASAVFSGAGSSDAPAADNAGSGSFMPAFVYCIPVPDSTGRFAQTPVGQNGEFSLSNLSAGTYRILAFRRPQQELEYEDAEAMRAYDSKGVVVRLVPGQREHVRLPLISPGE
jgi:hypothetical protein